MVRKIILKVAAVASLMALSQTALSSTPEFCEEQKQKFERGCSLSMQSCIRTTSSVEACVASSQACFEAAAASYEQCLGAFSK